MLKLAIALISSFVAGLYDLKTSDIPNKLILLIFLVGTAFLLLNALHGSSAILTTAIWLALLGPFAFVLYKLGAWGAGDCAMLLGMVYLLADWQIMGLPFCPVYLFTLLFVGLFYSIAYMFVLLAKNSKAKARFAEKIKPFKKFYVPLCGLFIFTLALGDLILCALSFLLLLAPLAFGLSACSRELFYRRVRTAQLKPGYVLGQDVPELGLRAREIRGLTKAEVLKLARARKYVWIRDGVRYGPVFFISLLVLFGLQLFA